MVDKIQITKTRRVKTPARGTAVAAGLDFFVPEDLTDADMEKMFSKTGHPLEYAIGPDGFVSEFVIKPGQSACIPSGIKARLPHGYCMEFHNKSGVACKKSLLAGSCLIDEDYQGEWHIDVHNVSSVNAAHVFPGDKIAQFVMYKVEYPAVELVDTEAELFAGAESERGEGAFGSTGTK